MTSEPFSSSDLPHLKDVDGLGDLSSFPEAAAELAQDVPGLDLGVRAIAQGAQPGVGGVGGFLRWWLAAAPVRDENALASADIALVGQRDEPGGDALQILCTKGLIAAVIGGSEAPRAVLRR